MTIERRFSKVTLRAEQTGGQTYLTGYAATYNTLSSDLGGWLERIVPGAFTRALAERQDVRHLVNHDPSLILGRTKSGSLELTEDSKGLKFRTLLPDTATAKDLAELVARGDVDQCSFAFSVVDQQWVDEPDPADGTMRVVRELHDVDLSDVSIVTYPAYPGTSAGIDGRALFPGGVPAEVRAHMGNTIKRDAVDGDGEDLCGCDCPECQAGDCADCSNEDCTDPNCQAAVQTAANEMAARAACHGLYINGGADEEADRAARARRLQLAAME